MADDNKEKEHKEVTIWVNTLPHPWGKKDKISFEEVVVLAFGSYSNDENIVYTVNYAKGPESNHEGSLVKGKEVKVKDGMIFNATQTNKG
jgi:hypothetical protein